MAEEKRGGEPEYVDEATGKPIVYADNVPEMLRKKEVFSEEQVLRAKAYEAIFQQAPLELARRGVDAWNTWVRVYKSRWLVPIEHEEKIVLHIVDEFGPHFDIYNIDFAEGQKKNSKGQFTVSGLNFDDFVFPCTVYFITAKFDRVTRFRRAIFASEVHFDHAVFDGAVSFTNAQFGELASFVASTFFGTVHFTGVSFLGDVNFTDTKFSRTAKFRNTSLKKGGVFTGATFMWNADFHKAVSGEALLFGRVLFEQTASFRAARFHQRISFHKSTFKEQAIFSGCSIRGEFLAENVAFRESCKIDGVLFFGDAIFNGAIWQRSAVFTRTKFYGQAAFLDCSFGGHIDLDHCVFGSDDSKGSLSIPSFIGAHFSEPANLGYTVLGEIFSPANQLALHERIFLPYECWRVSDADSPSKLRKLQRLAADGHNHYGEKRFFRAELLCRRGHEATAWREITMINLFELFSGCGLSFRRPALWLLGLIVACGVIYFSQIDWTFAEMNSDGESWFDLVSYSVLNSLPLIGYASDTYGVSVNVLFGGIENVPWPVKVTAFFQNIASAVLLFFALLAIRNYFKLG